jgi:hypothetical protein
MKIDVCSSVTKCLIGAVFAGSVLISINAVADDPPLSCVTADSRGGGNNYMVEAMTGINGEFPLEGPCPDDDSQQCADFGYMVSSLLGATVSHTLFAADAEYVIQEDPSASMDIYDPGTGSPDGFLAYAMHEKAVRFNSNATTFEAHIYVVGDVEAGATTAYVQGGRIDEYCRIAGPGNVDTLSDVWQPLTTEKNVNVLHGACDATLHYNGRGDVVNITLPPDSPCFAGQIPVGAKALLGNEVIQNARVPDGISFGDESTIIYLPSGWAVCTAAPCPGTTTYRYTY